MTSRKNGDNGHEVPRTGLRHGERTITELGEPFEMRENERLQPVKFDDGTYAVITVNTDHVGRVSTHLFKSGESESNAALNGSLEMLRVQLGIGSGVMRIYGRDTEGPFVVKVYGNDKAGRPSEVRR
ncbi:MAG: hypothetical protein WC866_01090 [Patescibacteria group bacterium]|jgi:hypothetical protein